MKQAGQDIPKTVNDVIIVKAIRKKTKTTVRHLMSIHASLTKETPSEAVYHML